MQIPRKGKSHSATRRRAMPPARARARRSLMADDDEPPTASTSALRSAWVDDPPFRRCQVLHETCRQQKWSWMPSRSCRPMRLRSIERCTSAGRKPGDESSGGVMSCARKRSAALARAPACRGRAWEAESCCRAREEAGVRGARVRQCSSGGGGSDGSYLCTRHRRDATVSSASMRTPRREGDCAKLPSRLPRNRKYP